MRPCAVNAARWDDREGAIRALKAGRDGEIEVAGIFKALGDALKTFATGGVTFPYLSPLQPWASS